MLDGAIDLDKQIQGTGYPLCATGHGFDKLRFPGDPAGELVELYPRA